jgi:flavin reductase (DIM6/NTAB) family NADH-FMN oxidoreductase RutF
VPVFDLGTLPVPERSRLLNRVVAPRPIAFVSTLNAAGQGNLAPFSYFVLGGNGPPSCAFSPTLDRNLGSKHTLDNIRATGEYVINICTRPLAERINKASFEYPGDVDEFDIAGFTRASSIRVQPPRVAECPVSLECRLFQIVPHGNAPGAANYVIGEILVIHADDSVCVDGVPDERLYGLVARGGADRWVSLRSEDFFSLPRPTEP